MSTSKKETHSKGGRQEMPDPRRRDTFRIYYGEDIGDGHKLYTGEKLKSNIVRRLYSLSIEEGNATVADSSDSAIDEVASDASRENSFVPSSRASSPRSADHGERSRLVLPEPGPEFAHEEQAAVASSHAPLGQSSRSGLRNVFAAEPARITRDLLLDEQNPSASVTSEAAIPADWPLPVTENLDLRFSARETRPKFVSKYVLGARLGEGAYAKVKEAMDTTTLRIVACKIVDKRFLRKIRGGLENVRREIAIMRMLDHPNIVRLLDVIDREDTSKLYLFMELSNGCTVQELIERAPQKRLPSGQAQAFFSQLIEGIAYIHSRNIVHRDIKPSNLMLATDGMLKITDFGVAEFLDKFDAEGRITRTVGSPAFQAPEIARGNGVFLGRKVDAWAAGVTLYMMLTGEAPFKGANQFELFRNISQGTFSMPSHLIDEECQDLLRRLMEPDPERRATVDDLRDHAWLRKRFHDDNEWIPIPRRHPKILDIVSRLYEDDRENTRQSTSPIESDGEKSSVQASVTATNPLSQQEVGRQSSAGESRTNAVLPNESTSKQGYGWHKGCTLM
jgi:serine/threonine-protein kinase 11